MAKFRVQCGTYILGDRTQQDRFNIKTMWEGDDLSRSPFVAEAIPMSYSWLQKPFDFSGGDGDVETFVWTEKWVDGEWKYYMLPEYYQSVADNYYEKFAKQEGKEVQEIAN